MKETAYAHQDLITAKKLIMSSISSFECTHLLSLSYQSPTMLKTLTQLHLSCR